MYSMCAGNFFGRQRRLGRKRRMASVVELATDDLLELEVDIKGTRQRRNIGHKVCLHGDEGVTRRTLNEVAASKCSFSPKSQTGSTVLSGHRNAYMETGHDARKCAALLQTSLSQNSYGDIPK